MTKDLVLNSVQTQVNAICPGNNKIMALPETDGGLTVFIPDADGAIKTTTRRFIFSDKLGDIYNFFKQKDETTAAAAFALSAGAYSKLKNFMGILVDFPKNTVNETGDIVPNPTKKYDERGIIKAISLLGIATGFNQFGEIIFARREISIDLRVKKIEYIFSLQEKYPGSVLFAETGKKPKVGEPLHYQYKKWNNEKREYEFVDGKRDVKNNTWIEIPVDEFTSLFCDLSHPEVVAKYRELNNILTTIERRLYTFVERNLIKALTGIQKVNAEFDKIKKDWIAQTDITAFRGKITKEEMLKIFNRLNAGEEIENLTIIPQSADEKDLKINEAVAEAQNDDDTDMDDIPNEPQPENKNEVDSSQSKSVENSKELKQDIQIDETLLKAREEAAAAAKDAKKFKKAELITQAREKANIVYNNGKVDWEACSIEQLNIFMQELRKLLNSALDQEAVKGAK